MFIKIKPGLPGGMKCKNCSAVNTLDWLTQTVVRLSSGNPFITVKMHCSECHQVEHRSYSQLWDED